MIDTDKYEGHNTNTSWKVTEWIDYIKIEGELNEIDAKLIADAPLLLAEVKRLRERIDEFGLAVTDMLPMWDPGDYDEMEINGKRKIVVDEDWWRWMATHIETLLYPVRYHVEGKRYNHDTCKWEEEE